MTISMIAAVARNYTIGNGKTLPWEIPTDMKYFMATTRGHHVIMGRTSFEDIGTPLADRTNIIVTRQTDYSAEGAFVVHSIEEALLLAEVRGEQEVFIIGGEKIFTQGLEKADKLYITWIDAEFDGDTHFPRFDQHAWHETQRTNFASDAENPYPYSFAVLERV